MNTINYQIKIDNKSNKLMRNIPLFKNERDDILSLNNSRKITHRYLTAIPFDWRNYNMSNFVVNSMRIYSEEMNNMYQMVRFVFTQPNGCVILIPYVPLLNPNPEKAPDKEVVIKNVYVNENTIVGEAHELNKKYWLSDVILGAILPKSSVIVNITVSDSLDSPTQFSNHPNYGTIF